MERKYEYGKVSSEQLIKEVMNARGLQQRELAQLAGEHFQTISAILSEKRSIPVKLSVKLDALLGFPQGFLAMNQTAEQVKAEGSLLEDEIREKKLAILKKVKANGGLWSYSSIPEHLEDDAIIEEGLLHLEFEDMPELFSLWSSSHIKRIWRERLVPQGPRLSILNFLLAVLFFHIHNPKQYLKRYARYV